MNAQFARRLIDAGLIAEREVVDGDLSFHELSQRNRCILVARDGQQSYLIKENDRVNAHHISRERAHYRRAIDGSASLPKYLPRFFDIADFDGLVLEGFPEAERFDERQHRLGEIPVDLAADLGRVLSTVHQPCPPPEPPTQPPWALVAHRPYIEDLAGISPGSLQLLRHLQPEEHLVRALDEMREGWTCSAEIHGDIRWANVLVDATPATPSRLILVDWETAGSGDPAWDVGCGLASFLTAWIVSIPEGAGPAQAAVPLERLRAPANAFWHAYQEVPRAAKVSLADTMCFCAARLVQTAFEATAEHDLVDHRALLHLQLASNIVLRPDSSADDLLGLTPTLAQ